MMSACNHVGLRDKYLVLTAIFLLATLSFWDPVPNSHQFFFFFLLEVKFCTIVNSFNGIFCFKKKKNWEKNYSNKGDFWVSFIRCQFLVFISNQTIKGFLVFLQVLITSPHLLLNRAWAAHY
jgi:hypothetical protein